MSIAVGASSRYLSPSWYAGIGIACLILGVVLTIAPVVAFALIGLLLGLWLLQFPAYTWVTAAVLTATLSRLFVAGGVPPIVNFFHFPLALGAALVAALGSPRQQPTARTIAAGCITLLLLSFTSWVLSGGALIPSPLTWLVFAEPFLILYAVVNGSLSLRHHQFLGRLALVIPFTQLPVALWQTLTLGRSDPDLIQGTFIGMGAGHHVSGGIALIGAIICVARGLSALTSRERVPWLLGALALFLIPILSDAKQNIMAFLPALTYLFVTSRGHQGSSRRGQWTGIVVALPTLAFAIYAAFIFYPPLQVALDWNIVSHGLEGKTDAFFIIAEKVSHNFGGWLFGLGPGNSVSRVALMAMEGYIRADSPVTFLGLTMAPTTEEIWDMTFSNAFFARSSVWSGISSWFGLFGDSGFAGLLAYLWMSWRIWQNLGNASTWQRSIAKSAMIMTGLLGGIYSWLEEPGFTFPIALIVGLGLLSKADATSSIQQSSSPSTGSPRGESNWRQHTGAV